MGLRKVVMSGEFSSM